MHTIPDNIFNLDIYLEVLQLLHKVPLIERHTTCQQVLSVLPHHINDIALSPGWEGLFLWQLTPSQETRITHESSNPDQVCTKEKYESDSDMWRVHNIVLETIANILWVSTDNHSKNYPWKVSYFVISEFEFLPVNTKLCSLVRCGESSLLHWMYSLMSTSCSSLPGILSSVSLSSSSMPLL